jgi:hypothetical protein
MSFSMGVTNNSVLTYPNACCPAAALGMRLMSLSKQLVAALLPLTTHKRHTVRIAALQAIRGIMHQV